MAALRAQLESAERVAWENKARRADAVARLKDRERLLEAIQQSPVWKFVKPLWKLHRHLAAAHDEKGVEEPEELRFTLDAPSVWTTSHEILVIKGWCYSGKGHELAGIRAKVGRKSYLARYGLERRDVAQSSRNFPGADRSGFSLEIYLPIGTSVVSLEAIVHGKHWQPFLKREVTRVQKDPAPEQSAAAGKAESKNRETEDEKRLTRFPDIRWNAVPDLLRSLTAERAPNTSTAPFFSVITPTHNTKAAWFAEAAASLLNQTLTAWEWCIVDDGSENRDLRRALDQLSSIDSRWRVRFIASGGISAATNHALDFAMGEFVCFLDHDDLLHPRALETMANKLREGFDVAYSDEDKLEESSGKLTEPFFKPDWSPEYFRGAMYVGHLLCVQRDLAAKIRFDSAFDGVQDFEFMLRVSETGVRIGHVPKVLYHWRKVPGSIAESGDAKNHIGPRQERAVNAHLKRLGAIARAEMHRFPHRLRIVPQERPSWPAITVIIPSKDSPELLRRCLGSLYRETSYPRFDVVLVDNETTDQEALAVMRKYPARRVPFVSRFNFSRANNIGVEHATGEYVVFLNNDTEIITPDWLQQLLYYAEQPDVGAVGAVLVYADRSVQHAGVALGMRGTGDHLMRGFPKDVDGYAGSLACAREVSAVTAACMMMRKSLFVKVGEFNEHFFTAYQDLDLCLRLRQAGLRLICTPEAVVVHHESLSRKSYYDMVDRMLLLDQWEAVIAAGDPYYNPNLDLKRGDYSPRVRA